MRHARTGKKLGRDSAHRKALYSNLTCSLIEHGRIRTTEAKAKAVKPFAEQMITLGRRGDLHARRQALSVLRSQEMVHKLFDDVGPRMADRPGGYSRIVKLGHRAGDAAEMVYLELVDYVPPEVSAPPPRPRRERAEEEPSAEEQAEPALAHGMENFPIEELELGVRSYNCLKRVGIETIGDLVTKSENELAAIPNFGKKSIEEVKETLATHGLNLRGGEDGASA